MVLFNARTHVKGWKSAIHRARDSCQSPDGVDFHSKRPHLQKHGVMGGKALFIVHAIVASRQMALTFTVNVHIYSNIFYVVISEMKCILEIKMNCHCLLTLHNKY